MSEDINRDQLVKDIQVLITKRERSLARWVVFLKALGVLTGFGFVFFVGGFPGIFGCVMGVFLQRFVVNST